jgi:hypothetical protein
VFNILGEGCFGQVWRCEALDIDGKYKNWLRHVPSQLHCRKIYFSPQTMLRYFIIICFILIQLDVQHSFFL